MRIEVNQIGEQGVVSSSYVELSPEQLSAIVKRAQEVTRLHRAGQPLNEALEHLDDALVSAQVMQQDGPTHITSSEVPVTPELVEAFSVLRESAANGAAEDQVVVSRAALENLGQAMRAAIAVGSALEWKWVHVVNSNAPDVLSQDLQAVLEKMAEVAKLGGAPSVREAMTKYPMLFCAAFANLVEEESRDRLRATSATTIVHVDNEDGLTQLTMVAPPGMGDAEVRKAVQAVVIEAADFDDIENRLMKSGFSQVEHVTVDIGQILEEGDSPGASPA